jgi:integrase
MLGTGDGFICARPMPTSRRFRMDLELAGIEREDSRGRVAVLHSLRHTFVSLLLAAGVDPVLVMQLARHRNINLTVSDYDDESMLPLAEAIGKLPVKLPKEMVR